MHPLLLAALIGGGVGGGSAYIQGRDPLKGALIGAATGAATSGLGSIFSPGAAAAKEAATQAAITSGSGAAGSGMTGNTLAQLAKISASRAPQTFASQFKNALTGGFGTGGIGNYAYGILPGASAAGEFLFNPRDPENPTKGYRPPLNMFYGRNPGRFGFGEFFDPDKIKEIYEDKDDPYYYPEGFAGGGIASLRPRYAEGEDVSFTQSTQFSGLAARAAEYLQDAGIEPTVENVNEVIEQVMAQQTEKPYEPLTGLAGQLQTMTQQYATPIGSGQKTMEGVQQQDMERAQMNMGGDPRRVYQEGGASTPMSPMLPTGDLDMRPGGESVGPGTGTSDDIPAMLSDGEFVMTAKAVEGAGGGDREVGSQRMMKMMRNFEQGGQPSPESQGLGSMQQSMLGGMA
tara:strand:- start:3485 stop:4690 length:1206 start_codon:yes stop_codon:yes gene_type:complete